MESSNLRREVIKEINLIPEEKLTEIYQFIHDFRLNIEASIGTVISNPQKESTLQQRIMQFAGSWNNMSDEVFADLSEEIATRRSAAFLKRRSDESSFD
ncbi:MAG: hypothetical protein VKN72_04930 [Nostocales cyanobacterium 94392]|nr:hypothetical protein [Nostocales cyanobacterium 94392]